MVKIKNLYEARTRKGYTQNELANYLDLSEKYVGLIERGERVPKLIVLIKMCEILEVSLDYLVGRESYEQSHLKEVIKRITEKDRENLISILDSIK